MALPWRSYTEWLRETYGGRVYRLGLDGGFSCPNRKADGSGGCAYCDGTGSRAAYLRISERGEGRAYDPAASGRILLRRQSLAERVAGIKEQIARGKEFVRRRYKADLFSPYFQAWTSTWAPVETLRVLYDAALEEGDATEFIVSTRPDAIDEEKADLLASYRSRVKRVWVELGLQSANDETLREIGRGHDTADWLEACALLRSRGLSVSAHIILGLPGEGMEDWLHTARVVAESGCEGIKIHNLHIPGGTALADGFLDGEVTAPGFERHLEGTVAVLRHIPSSVLVQRLVAETPMHRLLSPRSFGEKNQFIQSLRKRMEDLGARQGDSL